MVVKIDEKKPRFNGYEIARCIEFPDNEGGSIVERFDGDDAELKEMKDGLAITNVFWTLYGHLSEGGVEAIEDFDTEELAMELLYKITGIVGTPGQTEYPLQPAQPNRRLMEAVFDLTLSAAHDKLHERYDDSRALFADVSQAAEDFEAQFTEAQDNEQQYMDAIDVWYATRFHEVIDDGPENLYVVEMLNHGIWTLSGWTCHPSTWKIGTRPPAVILERALECAKHASTANPGYNYRAVLYKPEVHDAFAFITA